MRRESPFRLGWAIVLAGATAIAVALVDGRWEGLIVTLVGTPSELMVFAHGRTGVAEVKLVGEPDALAALHATDLRL